MNARKPLERWLLGATVASGLLVALAHSGGPTGCATTRQVGPQAASGLPLQRWQQPALVLKKRVPATATSAPRLTVARLERGELLEVREARALGGSDEYEATLLGFDPVQCGILITTDGERVEVVPCQQVQALTVLVETRTGAHVGNGALIGGATGAAVGGIAGLAVGGEYGPVCAVGFGVPLGGIGAGIGAGVGAVNAPGAKRTEYRISAYDWQIEIRTPATAEGHAERQ